MQVTIVPSVFDFQQLLAGCYLRGWSVLDLLSCVCGYKKSSQRDAFGGRCSWEKGNDFSVVAVVWWDKHKCRRLRLGFPSRFAADWQGGCGSITGNRHKPHLGPPCQSLAQCKSQGSALGLFSCSLESTWGCSISCSPVQRPVLRVQFRYRWAFSIQFSLSEKKRRKQHIELRIQIAHLQYLYNLPFAWDSFRPA